MLNGFQAAVLASSFALHWARHTQRSKWRNALLNTEEAQADAVRSMISDPMNVFLHVAANGFVLSGVGVCVMRTFQGIGPLAFQVILWLWTMYSVVRPLEVCTLQVIHSQLS